MYINRHISKVVERQQKRKAAIILTGARQVGKSTMLKTVLKGVRYISLDNPTVRAGAVENPSGFLEVYKTPIIIDEIQKVPKLFEFIKEKVDDTGKKGQYYLTGSQSFKLMHGVTESLAGRAGIITMLGLSLREINNIDYTASFLPVNKHFSALSQMKKKHSYTDIAEIIHKGSFPELYETKTKLEDWADYYASYLQTYVERDIRDITNVHDMGAFIKFVKAVSALSGEQLNYTTLAEICGMDVNTTKRWVSILETSGLVYILQPYYNNLNKRLIKTPKIYFLDTGLLCYLCGWNTPQQLTSGARWGHIFETYVVGEILKSYYNNGVLYPPLYYYRDKEKNEIDLIIEDGGTLYPVEIKTSSDPNKNMVKGFGILKNIPEKKAGEGALICLSKNLLPLVDNVMIVPVDRI
jgi:predicted AAA+ superfamily ATPase